MSQNRLTKSLYRVIEKDENSATVLLADASHEVFKAHFEGMPLLPGFLQIDMIAEILDKEIEAINSAKFVQKILPNEQIHYVITPSKNGVRVKLYNQADLLCGDFKLKWSER